jgi:hypothetical protein
MCCRNQYYVQSNSSGYQTKESFQKMFKDHFIPRLISYRQSLGLDNKKILIILDNHSSRQNRQFYVDVKKDGIHFMTIPAHCSHFLQPLDVSVNGIFKQSLSRVYVAPGESTQV